MCWSGKAINHIHITIIKGVIMKLSTITNPITALTIQSAMSAATGNIVQNRNLIRTETAKANGFDSFEQSKEYFNREKRIKNSLWVERNSDGNLEVISKSLHLLFMDSDIAIYDSFKNTVTMIDLPHEFHFLAYSDLNIYYNFKNDRITFKTLFSDFEIIIEKHHNRSGVIVLFSDRNTGKPILNASNSTLHLEYSDFMSNSNPIADEQEFQVTRLMAEIVMTCEYDIKPYLSKYNLSKSDAKNIMDTALYLNEKSKGYDNVNFFEEKPDKMFPQAIGYLANIFLENAYSDNTTQGTSNYKGLLESMSINDENFFEQLKRMAKNSSDWYRFSYCG
jgi:hypothetical protein